jgi:hypothetical protein
LQDLDEAARKFLAWVSILAEQKDLNLSPFQVTQAETQRTAADSTVTARLPETYLWLLVPGQATPQAPIAWEALRLSGTDALAMRAGKKLRSDESYLTSFAATRLKMELDRVPLWRGDHVEIRQLVEDFARYLYLPRLKDPSVLHCRGSHRVPRRLGRDQGHGHHRGRGRDPGRRLGPCGAHGHRELPDAEVHEPGIREGVAGLDRPVSWSSRRT